MEPQDSVARMTEKELLLEFEKMLENMNLTEEKKEPLRRHPISKKKDLLTMHFISNARVISISMLSFTPMVFFSLDWTLPETSSSSWVRSPVWRRRPTAWSP